MDDLVQQFCAVTDASQEAGRHLLEACGGDLEMAVSMHLDGGATAASASPTAGPSHGNEKRRKQEVPGPADYGGPSEPDVRAPIPQKHEVLVEDQLHTFGPRPKRKAARSVFDGFRDFQAEARQQAQNNKTKTRGKVKTLEDLFRPPLDLLHKGSFQSLKDAGCQCNKWALVNVQDVKEFQCQVLNRDIWSNEAVRSIVKNKFLLWQVYSDSEDGKRFAQYYKVNKCPYVAILDPQTGENLISWDKFDAITFCDLLTEFLALHPSPQGSTSDSPPNKRTRVESIIDSSEDSQLEAAIKASLNQPKAAVFIDSDDESIKLSSEEDLETFSDSDNSECEDKVDHDSKKALITETPLNNLTSFVNGCENSTQPNGSEVSQSSSSSSSSSSDEVTEQVNEEWKKYLGQDSGDDCQVVFRLPQGNRSQISVPKSSKLRALVMYVASQGFSNERYELMIRFPQRKLSYVDFDQTLKELNFHPQEVIFVQERT